MQLLRAQIPKVQKDSQLKQLCTLLGSAGVKDVWNYIDEIDTRKRFNLVTKKDEIYWYRVSSKKTIRETYENAELLENRLLT